MREKDTGTLFSVIREFAFFTNSFNDVGAGWLTESDGKHVLVVRKVTNVLGRGVTVRVSVEWPLWHSVFFAVFVVIEILR